MQGKWQELSLFKYISTRWALRHNRPQFFTLQLLTSRPPPPPAWFENEGFQLIIVLVWNFWNPLFLLN